MKQDFSLISNVIEKDPEYPDGLKYPFYTHKHANGSGTGLVWICEDCGYTAEFSYRNDMICSNSVCYCKRCKCSQLLNFYYNGQYKPHVCCECKKGDQLEEWMGDLCPKCGGKIKQFNAFHIKQEYKNYNYYYVDKNVTIFDTIREKDCIKTECINKYIALYVQNKYNIDLNTATPQALGNVDKILVSNQTMSHDYGKWDFSIFPNLKIIDCSYNPIDELIISKNTKLEEIRWEASRGAIGNVLDLSHNPNLKRIYGGQDGIIQLDLSANHELEILNIFLSSSLRWLDLSVCNNLRIINLIGVNIPFVDLTNCRKLEHVNINYQNLYQDDYNTYGPGYPRPIIFVREDFDENIISENTRRYDYYTYFLIRVRNSSPEETFLKEIKALKNELVLVPNDRSGDRIAKLHYDLLNRLKELRG